MNPQLIFHHSGAKISVMSQRSTRAVCNESKNDTTNNYFCFDELFNFNYYTSANISSSIHFTSFLHAFEHQHFPAACTLSLS